MGVLSRLLCFIGCHDWRNMDGVCADPRCGYHDPFWPWGDSPVGLAKIERERAARGEGCLGKAADDEPVFILRGQDMLAPGVVETWAAWAANRGCPPEKVEEAYALARAMRNWPKRKLPD